MRARRAAAEGLAGERPIQSDSRDDDCDKDDANQNSQAQCERAITTSKNAHPNTKASTSKLLLR